MTRQRFRRHYTSLLARVGLAALAAACSGGLSFSGDEKGSSSGGSLSGDFAGAPAWVRQGCESTWAGRGRLVCGIGSMSGTRNATRARSTAITRARTEIARSLETKVAAMLKDYASATTASAGAGSADELQIVDVSRQITRVSLSGTELRDTWTSSHGTVFALVVLDLEAFEQSLAGMTELPGELRQALRDGARASALD